MHGRAVGRRLLATALAAVALLGASAGASATWSPGPAMLDPTTGAAATRLGDGTVLVAGGASAPITHAVNERLDPATMTWSPVAPLLVPRGAIALVALHDGSALAVGGSQDATFPVPERYDPLADAWAQTGPPDAAARGDRPAVVVLPDGRVVSIGGGHHDIAYNDTDVYDPATDAWTRGADYVYFIRWNAATVLADGRVLSAGGLRDRGDLSPIGVDTVRVYDPGANAWSAAASLPAPRVGASAVTLHDGRVLLAGGSPEPSGLLYDPAADGWTPTGPLPAGADPDALALLPDGRALAVGGTDPGTGTTSAALFDPATHGWTDAGPLLAQRGDGFTATPLADGRVLVAGGHLPDGTILSSTEIWSPGAAPPPPPRCEPHPGHGHGKAKGRHKHRHECKGGHGRGHHRHHRR